MPPEPKADPSSGNETVDRTQSVYEREQQIAGDVPGELLLPVIRRSVASGSAIADRLDDVIAVYPHRLVMMTIRRKVGLPDAAFALYGAEALLQMESVGPVLVTRWEDIRSIQWTRVKRYGSALKLTRDIGREFRVTLEDGREARCFLPEEEAAMMMIALERLVLEKTKELRQLPRFRPGKPPVRRRETSMIFRLWFWLMILDLGIVAYLFWNAGFTWPEIHDGLLTREGLLTGEVWIPFVSIGSVPVLLIAFVQLLARASCPSRAREYRVQRKAHRRAHEASKRALPENSGKEPFRNGLLGFLSKLIGAACLLSGVAGVLALVFCQAIPEGDARTQTIILTLLMFFAAPVFAQLGFHLSVKPLKARKPTATERPVVFLRPFDVDRRYDFNADCFLTQAMGLKPAPLIRFLGPLASLHPLRTVRLLLSRTAERAEEQMASFFRYVGPFVAVGRPGGKLLTADKKLTPVSNDNWQDTVREWVDRSAFVVLQPGWSEGRVWEIKQSFDLVACARVLLCLSRIQGSQARWDATRLALLQNQPNLDLPRYVGDAPFIHFSENGVAERLPRIHAHPLKWAWTGRTLDFEKTLQPFVEKLGFAKAAQSRSGRRRPTWFESFASAVATNVAFLLLPVLLVALCWASVTYSVPLLGDQAPDWMKSVEETWWAMWETVTGTTT